MSNNTEVNLDDKVKEVAEQLKGLSYTEAKTVLSLANKWLEKLSIVQSSSES